MLLREVWIVSPKAVWWNSINMYFSSFCSVCLAKPLLSKILEFMRARQHRIFLTDFRDSGVRSDSTPSNSISTIPYANRRLTAVPCQWLSNYNTAFMSTINNCYVYVAWLNQGRFVPSHNTLILNWYKRRLLILSHMHRYTEIKWAFDKLFIGSSSKLHPKSDSNIREFFRNMNK